VSAAPEPIFQALVDAAVNGTGGTDGWILARRDGALEVVATSGSSAVALGTRLPADAGTAGFVVGSGQPIALAPRPGAELTSGLDRIIGREPKSIVAVPCESDDGVIGVLEVIDKARGGSFTFDDVELATLLAGIAGVALQELSAPRARVPDPGELAGELRRLAETAPTRYAAVATVLSALIASG
jgi:GAF domain-containing protein